MAHRTTHRTTDTLAILSLLAALGLQAACAADNGISLGTGGALGTGGTLGGGSGGTTGGETLALKSPRPCTAAATIVAPADGLIADFADPDAGIDVGGARLAYPIGSPSAPTYATTGGSLHLTVATPETSVAQYLGVVVGFPNRTCMDATAYTGVEFLISGSFSGCALRYYTNDDAHQDHATGATYASGPAGAYPPQTPILAEQVTSTPRILRMPFSGQSGGSPSTPIDPARLIILGWQFDVDAGTSSTPGSCIADLTIDDVRFY